MKQGVLLRIIGHKKEKRTASELRWENVHMSRLERVFPK